MKNKEATGKFGWAFFCLCYYALGVYAIFYFTTTPAEEIYVPTGAGMGGTGTGVRGASPFDVILGIGVSVLLTVVFAVLAIVSAIEGFRLMRQKKLTQDVTIDHDGK